MKEQIYSILNSIAPSFHRSAPDDYTDLPVIIYDYLLRQPLYLADNKASKEKRIVLSVKIYGSVNIEELANEVIDSLENGLKAVYKNDSDVSEGDVFGLNVEFDIYDFIL